MSTSELLWFTVGIAGFVMLLEGAITFIVTTFFKSANLHAVKAVAGAIIFVVALVALFRLPGQ